jgi:lipoprotein-releasing system permease protein
MLFTFAKKYLFSKKNTRAINIISWVSIVAIAIGTASLITVLSAFNGIDAFVRSLYTSFYTDVKISSIKGKTFEVSDSLIYYLEAQKNIVAVGKCLEENVLLSVGVQQTIVTLKGIDKTYANITKISDAVQYGDTNIFTKESRIIVGKNIANSLNVSEQTLAPLSVFAFQKKADLGNAPQEAYIEALMYVAGVFSVQDEFDSKYCLTSLQQMQQLLGNTTHVSAVELKVINDNAANNFVETSNIYLAKFGLKAATRYEQNKTLYYVLKSEKWMVFAIMSFMLLIASFNMVGCISMLVFEKKKDIYTLKALGAHSNTIRNIFLSTGIFIGLVGAAIGTVLALLLCILQQHFKFVKMGSGNFLLDAYPIKMIWSDFILVFLVVISILASWTPSIKAAKI